MADLRPKRINRFIEPFRVEPGRMVRLARDYDPDFTTRPLRKGEAKQILGEGIELLAEYQARLAAQDMYGVVVVLQAMDAAGKDGTIRHVMSGVDPQGVEVRSFRIPSSEELNHDFLWRYQRALPERGHIGIFNRSHYEEVLVVRVHPQLLAGQKLPPSSKGKDVWARRYREINDWEQYLTDQGYRFVKLFLNLSQEEQRRRFLARIDLPEKNWKFRASDARERAYWDAYQRAFSEMLSNTSTEWAPWHVVPADNKRFARIVAGAVLVDALLDIGPEYPKVDKEAMAALQEAKTELEAQAPKGEPPDPVEAALAAGGPAESDTGRKGRKGRKQKGSKGRKQKGSKGRKQKGSKGRKAKGRKGT